MLARIPAFIYAGAYLLLVPLFAFIYTASPDGFYYTAATLEQSLAVDAKKLAPALASLITDSYRTVFHTTNIATDAFSFDLTSGVVTGVESDGTFLKFRYEIRGDSLSETNAFGGNAIFDFSIAVFDWNDPLQRSLWQGNDGDHYILLHSVGYALGTINPTPDDLLPYVPEHHSGGHYLVENPEVWSRIVDFCQKSRGMAAVGSGSFRRMLYFSVVTITTLGYGDIVPLTDKARTLVAIESISGIVLIGLFLNSLAHKKAC